MFFHPCSGLSFPLGKTLFCKMMHIRTHIYNKHVHVQILPKHVHIKETVKFFFCITCSLCLNMFNWLFCSVSNPSTLFLQYGLPVRSLPASVHLAHGKILCHRTHLFPNIISKVDFQKVTNVSWYNCHCLQIQQSNAGIVSSRVCQSGVLKSCSTQSQRFSFLV